MITVNFAKEALELELGIVQFSRACNSNIGELGEHK